MIKKIERGKDQDQGDYIDIIKSHEPVIREDGLPTIYDLEKLLDKEGKVTGKKEEKMESEEVSPLDMVVGPCGHKGEDDKEKRKNDIIKFVESILSLAE